MNSKIKISTRELVRINIYIKQALDAYTSFESFNKIKPCRRFFPKTFNDSFLCTLSVLKAIMNPSNFIKGFDTSHQLQREKLTARGIKDVLLDKNNFHDAIKVLKCNNLIIKKYIDASYYIINEKKWYEDVQFKLKDRDILETLTVLLLAYVRIDKSYQANDFFKIIDQLFIYALQTSISHNKNSKLEYLIYEALAFNDILILHTIDKVIEINPLGIEVDENSEKKLTYENISDDNKTNLNNIKKQSIQISAIKSIEYPNCRSSFLRSADFTNNDLYTDKIQIEKETALLVVNSLLYDYFDSIHMFKEMNFLTDNLEIYNALDLPPEKIFDKLYIDYLKKTPSADIFLLKISGDYDEDLLVQEVQKNLQYIKVISPSTIAETINNNMLLYQKNLAL